MPKKDVAAYRQFCEVLGQLAPLPESEIKKACELFQPRVYHKEAYFVQAGEIPHNVGFLADGLMRFFYLDEAGHDFTKSFCDSGEFLGVYGANLLNQPSHVYVQALEDSLALVADFKAFAALLDSHPAWQTVGRRIVEFLFLKKERRESELLLYDAPTRYQRFLEQFPGLENRVKQYHIASYLGITPVSLSRIRAKLEKDFS